MRRNKEFEKTSRCLDIGSGARDKSCDLRMLRRDVKCRLLSGLSASV